MPPRSYCPDHTALVEKVGELRGDVKGLGKSLDTLRTQTLTGFREASQKADQRHRELKTALNGHIKELKFEDDEKTGEIQIVKQQVNKLDRWRDKLIVGGAIIFVLLSPLIVQQNHKQIILSLHHQRKMSHNEKFHQFYFLLYLQDALPSLNEPHNQPMASRFHHGLNPIPASYTHYQSEPFLVSMCQGLISKVRIVRLVI